MFLFLGQPKGSINSNMINKFNTSKYTNWYNNIIKSALSRPFNSYKDTYTINIFPKCMGGDDRPENLAKITEKEWMVCHHCLTKMTSHETTVRIANVRAVRTRRKLRKGTN